MSQFLSDKYLRFRPALAPRDEEKLIDTDLACRNCTYNLRGLRSGGVCPECGTPILPGITERKTLVDLPLPLLRRLRLGFWVVIFTLPLLLGGVLMGVISQANPALISGFALAVSLVWTAGVYLVTPAIDMPEAERRSLHAASRLRLGVRLTQFAWPVAYLALIGAGLVYPMNARAGAMLLTAATIMQLGGMVGVVLFSLLMMRIADWAMDEFAEKQFNRAAWVLAVFSGCVPLTLAFQSALIGFACTAIAMWLYGMMSFLLGLVTIWRTVDWAARCAVEQHERNRNLRLKVRPDLPRPQ